MRNVESEAKLAVLITAHGEAQTQREVVRSSLEAARSSFIRLDVAIAAEREELTRLESELGSVQDRNVTRSALKDTLLREEEALKAATKNADVLRADAPDVEGFVAAASRASSVVKRAQVESAALENDIAELNGRIIVSAGNAVEEIYDEVNGKKAAVEARIGVFEREVAALLRLKQALDSARVAAKEQYFKPVMAELKPLLTLLLDEASITFDDSTLLPQSLARNGLEEDIAVLSAGMREQLAILTRLAFARLLARGGDAVPVILDDALVYSDDNRIERMFDALHRQAKDLQILVLTCRQRAFERLGGNGLRMIEWIPLN